MKSLTAESEIHFEGRRGGRRVMELGPAPVRPKGRVPRITRLMALAIHCDELLRTGQVANQSALAEYAQITPARSCEATRWILDPFSDQIPAARP